MDEAAKVQRAAALLIERDGPGALDVATLRAKGCASTGDSEGARVWTIIAEAIAAMMKHVAAAAQPRPELREEPPLDDDDDVERSEIERIIDEISRKLEK
jgi:hypothetical protein